jgi:D-amino-acid oxidase
LNRRSFLRAGGAASLGLALGGCAPRLAVPEPAPRGLLRLPAPDISWERIIRTTVGLRPNRASGFRLEAERLDDRTVIHNFGHGGAGMSLSWGTAHLAADLALAHDQRRAAVIGCGIVGLTTARVLQRRGFEVTIYAATVPPDTTSNLSMAAFTPVSGLVASSARTPAWEAKFRRAVEIAYREHQLLVGRGYGVAWLDEYTLTNSPAAGQASGLLPDAVTLGDVVFGPGEHPFPTRFARRRPTLRFEPSIYLDALMRDVLIYGGQIVVRSLESPRDLAVLPESLIVNCTGLGSRALFGDEELTPVRGQLVVLVPQPEVDYSIGSMLPRADGIVLGHTMDRGEWSLEVDDGARRRVMETHMQIFRSMPPFDSSLLVSRAGGQGPAQAPPVESFFEHAL